MSNAQMAALLTLIREGNLTGRLTESQIKALFGISAIASLQTMPFSQVETLGRLVAREFADDMTQPQLEAAVKLVKAGSLKALKGSGLESLADAAKVASGSLKTGEQYATVAQMLAQGAFDSLSPKETARIVQFVSAKNLANVAPTKIAQAAKQLADGKVDAAEKALSG